MCLSWTIREHGEETPRSLPVFDGLGAHLERPPAATWSASLQHPLWGRPGPHPAAAWMGSAEVAGILCMGVGSRSRRTKPDSFTCWLDTRARSLSQATSQM